MTDNVPGKQKYIIVNESNRFNIYQKMFKALDIDDSGFVPLSELQLALEKLGITFNTDALNYIVEITD